MTNIDYDQLRIKLIEELKDHPHREEILQILEDQRKDDTYKVL